MLGGRRRLQPGDQPQEVVEHLSRHCDLRHLEHDVAAVADHLGGDLDPASPANSSGTTALLPRASPGSHEVADVVSQCMELKANRVGSEGTA